jgi:hypothetical protein
VPLWFVRKGVDGARNLAIAPRPSIAFLFWLIATTVIFPVASAGVLDAWALHQLTLIIIGAITIVLNVTALLIAIVVRVASCNA